jgi:hypothetical protein
MVTMSNQLFEYIHSAMCTALNVLDDLSNDDYNAEYNKLDSAIDKFYTWYKKQGSSK